MLLDMREVPSIEGQIKAIRDAIRDAEGEIYKVSRLGIELERGETMYEMHVRVRLVGLEEALKTLESVRQLRGVLVPGQPEQRGGGIGAPS